MSRLLTQMKEQLLSACFPIGSQHEPVVLCEGPLSEGLLSEDLLSEGLSDDNDKQEFSVECLLRVVKIRDKAELISRVLYHFPKEAAVSAKDALCCANKLNDLLIYSRVCVVQNIDGDGRFSLRMDTLLKGTREPHNISRFLEEITSDVAIILEYFAAYLPTLSRAKSSFNASFNSLLGTSSGSSFQVVSALRDSSSRLRRHTHARPS